MKHPAWVTGNWIAHQVPRVVILDLNRVVLVREITIMDTQNSALYGYQTVFLLEGFGDFYCLASLSEAMEMMRALPS